MTSPARLLIALVVLGGTLTALYFAVGSRRAPRTQGSDPGEQTTRQDPAPTPFEVDGGDPVPRNGLAAGTTGREATGQAAVPEGVPLLRVAGRIVAARTDEPIRGATLALDAPDDYMTVRTDDHGRFELALRSDAWQMGETYRAIVTQEGNRRLFLGNVVLEPELLIRARLRLLLRGRLLANFDLSGTKASVQAHVPPAGSVHVAVYAGRADLDEEGRFEIEAWSDREPASFRLTFEAAFSRLLIADVPTSELLSEAGATLRCSVGELILSVVDGEGKPLPAASIRVFSGGAGADSAWFEAATNDEGGAQLLVAPGRLELCVGREGYSFGHRLLELGADLAPRTETFQLRLLGPEEQVTGRVLDAEGEPLGDAFVSGSPRTEHPEVATAGHVGVPSDEDGVFLLPIAGERPIEVTAYHEDHGVTVPVVLAPGQRTLTLRFEPTGGLEVDLTGIPSEAGAVADSVQWILVGERTFSSHAWGVPFEIEHVPEGTYELFVYLARAGLVAQHELTIVGDEYEELRLPVTRVPQAAGTLSRADGSRLASCDVALVETDWPEAVYELWGRSTTDAEGRFRLPLGPSGRGRAVVLDATGNELGRLKLVAGEAAHSLP